MKTNEFIKKFGWDLSKLYSNGWLTCVDDSQPEYKVCRDDIKRYVDAYELVQMFYAKPSDELHGWENHLPSETKNALREAVQLVEECQ